jgi:hypothetical protein
MCVILGATRKEQASAPLAAAGGGGTRRLCELQADVSGLAGDCWAREPSERAQSTDRDRE